MKGLNLPSASDLEYFLEIAEVKSISRGAERLGVTQPSLSLAMQRLERNFGMDLLKRSKSGIALTEAGESLRAGARELLEIWEDVRARAASAANEVKGSVYVGCHVSVALYSLEHILPQFLRQHPQLEIKLHHQLSRRVTDSVIAGDLDIGIVVNPVRHPDLVLKKLFSDEVTLWVARSGKTQSEILEGSATLIVDPDLMQSQSVMRKFKTAGLEFARVLPTTSLEVIARLTAADVGVGILPSRVAASERHGELKRVERAPSYKDEICVVYRQENKRIKRVQAVVDAIGKLN